MATHFGPDGNGTPNNSFIPVALDVSGAHGPGVEKFFKIIHQLRADSGKSKAPALMAFWRRRISLALHQAITDGADRRTFQLAKQHNLHGWRRMNRVVAMYAGEQLAF